MAEGSARRTKAMRAGAVSGALALAVGSIGLGSAVGKDGANGGGAPTMARATFADASGKKIGTIRFQRASARALTVTVAVSGLTPGFHGFHVHETGACVPPFTSAGAHYNPTEATHGGHAGDMPPLLVGGDGHARASFRTTSLTLAGLIDAGGDGNAVIIHAGSDNLGNIPSRYHSHTPDASSTTLGPDAETLATGDAGARTACGVVRRGTGRRRG